MAVSVTQFSEYFFLLIILSYEISRSTKSLSVSISLMHSLSLFLSQLQSPNSSTPPPLSLTYLTIAIFAYSAHIAFTSHPVMKLQELLVAVMEGLADHTVPSTPYPVKSSRQQMSLGRREDSARASRRFQGQVQVPLHPELRHPFGDHPLLALSDNRCTRPHLL